MWQGTKLIAKATIGPTEMFAVFYVCWFEDAVCSELENKNTTEH